MNIRLLHLFVVTFIFLPFFSYKLEAQVNASFSVSSASGCAPLSVTYTNTSTGASNYSWDLGNGNTSVIASPGATYTTPGIYTVILRAINGGATDNDTAVITVFANPTVAFSTSALPTCVGQNVLFTDNSIPGSGTIATRAWDFGDGTSESTAFDTIAHTFINGGTFPVTLIVTTSNGCSKNIVNTVEILDGPLADFIGSPLSSCAPPLDVAFTNTSNFSGPVSFEWTFGDGNTSTDFEPSNSFNLQGSFSVTLAVIQSGCSDTITKYDYIVIEDIVPDFSVNSTSVCVGDSVAFTDLSIPLSETRTWDFGDGSTSTQGNPTHVYSSPGTYAVSLFDATAHGCAHSEIKNNLITVYPNSIMSYSVDQGLGCSVPFTANFADNSTNAVSWDWDFGDGNNSNSKNPSNTYLSEGSFDVSLTVTSADGCQTTLAKSNYISISSPMADFLADTTLGCIPLSVVFNDSSLTPNDSIIKYIWDFGNGTDTTVNPSINRTYPAEGTYSVKLKVETAAGCIDSITKNNYIRTGVPPNANFIVKTPVVCHGAEVEFEDISTGGDSAFYEFGIGQGTFATPFDSVMPYNPILHSYPDTGVFSVTQIVFNNGCPDTMLLDSAVTVLPPNPLLSYELNCLDPYSVVLSDASEGADSIVWDFLDLSPLVVNDTNPTHVYATGGPMGVMLTAYNFTTGCSDTITQFFTIADPIAGFTTSLDTGCYNLPVTFTSTSIDDAAILWDFGDGSAPLADASGFIHNYTAPGKFTATLIITDVNGCLDTTQKEIVVYGAIPDFIADTVAGCTPLSVDFVDSSISDSTLVEWTWDFGDGSPIEITSNNNISHVYSASGVYSVQMDVEDINGCVKSQSKTDYIEVTFPTANFVVDSFACALEEVFIDGSGIMVAEPGVLEWDFGDGTTGIGMNPSHFFASDSLYTISLVVTDKNGCVDNLQKEIRIQSPGAAFTYSVISQGCGVADIQFTDQSTGLNINSWSWSFGDGASSPQQNPKHVYTKAGYFPVSLEVINDAGCADTVLVDSVLVLGPVGTFTFNPDRGCIPLEVTFTAESDNTINYIWDFGDGSVISTADKLVQHTYVIPDTATPILLLENFLPDGSPCRIPAPEAGNIFVTTMVAAVIDSIINEACFGDSLGAAFSSTSGGTLPYVYSWSTNPIQTTPTATNLPAGTFTLTVIDSNFCTIPAIAVITEPSQVITTASLNDTLCPGDTATLAATSIGGSGNYIYSWAPLGVINSGILNLYPTTDSVFYVTAYDSLNCMGTTDTVAAIVYKLDLDSILATSTSPICPGESSDISVQVDGLTGVLSYQWNNGLGNGPGIYQVYPTAPTTYIVAVTNHCGETALDSVDVSFNPPPTVLISADTNAICVASFLQFHDSSLTANINDPIVSWLWSFGDGRTSSLKEPSHYYSIGGTLPVSLTVTTVGGCTNSNAANPLIINTHEYPIANFSISSSKPDLPYDITITNNQSYGATTYFWDFGDGFTSQETDPQHLYESVGNYEIKLIAVSDFGCPDTNSLKLFPNANVIFPNVFTPNKTSANGGSYNLSNLDNDVFFPYTSGVVDFKLEIFNRWGELIFESLDINIGWDGYYRGVLCPLDVYIWKAYVKLNDGKIFNKSGDVTLLR